MLPKTSIDLILIGVSTLQLARRKLRCECCSEFRVYSSLTRQTDQDSPISRSLASNWHRDGAQRRGRRPRAARVSVNGL